jgi:hypothetical protein
MTSHEDLVTAHNTVAKLIGEEAAAAVMRIRERAAVLEAIRRIDNDEAVYDGHGMRVYEYQEHDHE